MITHVWIIRKQSDYFAGCGSGARSASTVVARGVPGTTCQRRSFTTSVRQSISVSTFMGSAGERISRSFQPVARRCSYVPGFHPSAPKNTVTLRQILEFQYRIRRQSDSYDRVTDRYKIFRLALVAVEALDSVFLRTAPLVFLEGRQTRALLWRNVSLRHKRWSSWKVISPDLSREKSLKSPPASAYTNAGFRAMARRGVVYTLAPSYKDIMSSWAGTDDGLIHVTRDGGKPGTMSSAELTSWSKVCWLRAVALDTQTAYTDKWISSG